MGADLIIQNDTFLSYDRSQYRQIFGQDFCDAVENTAGVRSVHAYYASDIIVPWEEGFADTWMNSFYDSVMSVPYEEDKAEYKQNPKRFYSIIGGIDEELFEKINADLEQPIGKEDFMSGKCCILYRNFAQLPDSRIIGQSFILKREKKTRCRVSRSLE